MPRHGEAALWNIEMMAEVITTDREHNWDDATHAFGGISKTLLVTIVSILAISRPAGDLPTPRRRLLQLIATSRGKSQWV
jgi:hypothetical protein